MASPLVVPPASVDKLSTGRQLAARLASLVGRPFRLTGKTRTDGSNVRKLVAGALEKFGKLPIPADDDAWRIAPPKKKGVPRLLREFADTYIVTTGSSYNLQVWNRNPTEPIPQIEFADGTFLRANDVRFVFVRIDPIRHAVKSVIVATPQYIAEHFGKFGKPTVKEQLIISARARLEVLARTPPILFYPDIAPRAAAFQTVVRKQPARIHDVPSPASMLSLKAIRTYVQTKLLGHKIEPQATKNRGQQLEKMVAIGLGYTVSDEEVMIGGYPDIRNQALEVKVQDAATVDLGRCSPQFDEPVVGCDGFTTKSVRYLIALTDPKSGICLGVILCPGRYLGEHFVYVAEKSFKCQRAIPMAFFDRFDNRAVFNPKYP